MELITILNNTEHSSNYLWIILIALLLSFSIAFAIIPAIIKMAVKLNMTDKPNNRKLHSTPVPTLGGIGIFIGLLTVSIITLQFNSGNEFVVVLLMILLVFLTGVVDDLKELSAKTKFLIQLTGALVLCYSDLRIINFGGFLGIYNIPVYLQYIVTILFIIGLTNALNLLDGINGLAGGVGFINSLFFGVLLLMSDELVYAIIAFALAGSLAGFLYYNFGKAKIFMGDSGSLVLGFVLSILSIKVLTLSLEPGNFLNSTNSVIIICGIVLIPLYDTTRVAIVRILNGVSPVKPDKNHIHHLLIKTGFNHSKSAVIIYTANIILIMVSCMISGLTVTFSAPVLVITAIFFTEILTVRYFVLSILGKRKLLEKMDDLIKNNRFVTNNIT